MYMPPAEEATDRYFLAGLPEEIAEETIHTQPMPGAAGGLAPAQRAVKPGMDFS